MIARQNLSERKINDAENHQFLGIYTHPRGKNTTTGLFILKLILMVNII